MNSITFVLQLIALVCLFFAAMSLFPIPRPSWGWLGMFLWLLSLMIGGLALHATYGAGPH
jgi:hypothetical protein